MPRLILDEEHLGTAHDFQTCRQKREARTRSLELSNLCILQSALDVCRAPIVGKLTGLWKMHLLG